jgi:hypothetical protein
MLFKTVNYSVGRPEPGYLVIFDKKSNRKALTSMNNRRSFWFLNISTGG